MDYTIWRIVSPTERELVSNWSSLVFWERLNNLQPLESLVFPSTSIQGTSLPDYAFIQITCGDRIAWSGHLIDDAWGQLANGPTDVVLKGVDLTAYAKRAVILPEYILQTYPTYTALLFYQEYVSQVAHADDFLRYLVRTQLISDPLLTARRHSDLTCEADQGLAAEARITTTGKNLLDELVRIAGLYDLWFRFVPTATGARFEVRQTWCEDHMAAGADGEILSVDRGSIAEAEVKARNYGDLPSDLYSRTETGSSWGRQWIISSDADRAFDYGRVESILDSTGAGTPETMLANAAQKIAASYIKPQLRVLFPPDTYGLTWHLGDKFWLYMQRGVRQHAFPVVITDVQITVTPERGATALPTVKVLA